MESCRKKKHFYSHPSVRGDRISANIFQLCPHFYSHPSVRGDRRADAGRNRRIYFYSHPSVRGDCLSSSSFSVASSFLLTPLREG